MPAVVDRLAEYFVEVASGLVRSEQRWAAKYYARALMISISTTVDDDLLGRARSPKPTLSDSELIEAALRALSGRVREARIHTVNSSFDESPIESFGEWGDLASFQVARIDTLHAARAA